MLGLGWTEMLVIGIAALIFVGPKDLPVVMNRVGKIIGQIRRMGSEFQREINKTSGLDEVRNLRNSITAPLKKTSDEIRREFNAMTPTGPKPSGMIKPADPKAESVVDEIRSAAGLTSPKTADQVAAEAGFKPAAAASATAETPVKKSPVRKVAVRAKAKAAPTSPVTTTDLSPLEVPAAATPRKAAATKASAKPRTKAAPIVGEPEPKPAARRAPAKPKKPVAESAKAGDE